MEVWIDHNTSCLQARLLEKSEALVGVISAFGKEWVEHWGRVGKDDRHE